MHAVENRTRCMSAWCTVHVCGECRCSMVELMCSTEQPPDYYVSMWQGDGLLDSVRCLVHHAYERGLESEYGYYHGIEMTRHPRYLGGRSPRYWLCAHALSSREEPGSELASEVHLCQSVCRRAMALSQGTVSIVDNRGFYLSMRRDSTSDHLLHFPICPYVHPHTHLSSTRCPCARQRPSRPHCRCPSFKRISHSRLNLACVLCEVSGAGASTKYAPRSR